MIKFNILHDKKITGDSLKITFKKNGVNVTGLFKKNKVDFFIDSELDVFYDPRYGKCGKIPDNTRNGDFFNIEYYTILKMDDSL